MPKFKSSLEPGFQDLFPTRIYFAPLHKNTAAVVSLRQRLLADAAGLRREDRLGKAWSKENYHGGYTSYASLSDLQHRTPTFMELEEFLRPHVVKFVRAQHWDMSGLELRMSSCWMNAMPKHTYHPLHTHPGSAVSGTFYLKSPPGSSELKIEDPRLPYFMAAPQQASSAPAEERVYFRIPPREGWLVLFESWLRHEVPPTGNAAERLSISFNYELES